MEQSNLMVIYNHKPLEKPTGVEEREKTADDENDDDSTKYVDIQNGWDVKHELYIKEAKAQDKGGRTPRRMNVDREHIKEEPRDLHDDIQLHRTKCKHWKVRVLKRTSEYSFKCGEGELRKTNKEHEENNAAMDPNQARI